MREFTEAQVQAFVRMESCIDEAIEKANAEGDLAKLEKGLSGTILFTRSVHLILGCDPQRAVQVANGLLVLLAADQAEYLKQKRSDVIDAAIREGLPKTTDGIDALRVAGGFPPLPTLLN